MRLVLRAHVGHGRMGRAQAVPECCQQPNPAFEIGGDGAGGGPGVVRQQRLVCMNCRTVLIVLQVLK